MKNTQVCSVIFLFFITVTAFVISVSALTESETNVIKNKVEERNVSIAFVFDTTASMNDVRRVLRKHAYTILEHIEVIQRKDNVHAFNYVLVGFNDPTVQVPFITTDKQEFIKALNDLRIHGGGDCPEPSLTAILKTLEVVSQMSHIFLFTDADSKECKISTEMMDLIARKQPSMYFIISGKCNENYDPIYKKLAEISGGQYFNVFHNKIEDLIETLETNMKPNRHKVIEERSLHLLSTPALEIDFTQSPFAPIHEDKVTFNCTLLSSVPISLTLTILLNGISLVKKDTAIQESMTIVHEINVVSEKDKGEYKCVLSMKNDDNMTILTEEIINLKVLDKRQVRRRIQLLPVLKNKVQSISCPLFTMNYNDYKPIYGWERNGKWLKGINNQTLTLSAADLSSTIRLICFAYSEEKQIKDEILFDILIGDAPTVTTASSFNESTNTLTVSCDVTVKHLYAIHILDHKNTYIADSSNEFNSIYLKTINNHFIKYSNDHHKLEITLTHEEFKRLTLPLTCVAYTPYGNKQHDIKDPLKGLNGSQNTTPYDLVEIVEITKNEGDTLRLFCSNNGTVDTHVRYNNLYWTKDTQQLHNDAKDIFVNDNLKVSDSGVYTCFDSGKELKRFVVKVNSLLRPSNLLLNQEWSEWGAWTSCSTTCGLGYQSRHRQCLLGNRKCKGSNYEAKKCYAGQCPYGVPAAIYELRNKPELLEWNGNGFDSYKDKEYSDYQQTHCDKGHTWNLILSKCVDINECKRGKVCQKGLKCVNTKGSYQCVTCPKGYMGIKERCLDLNECSLRTHRCQHICVNTHGSYRCACNPGFILEMDGLICQKIN